ncbi:glycosyltransferase family 15 protein [Tilletiaria anomala UBC 951]|uniref:Glycosyltransferase family 15 protein n=1 Tax=Tilletiaria anomala (strain ATCC 24038 / CBS 436.72 / UBC 951) TaxID=1037660 RepID=A0A066WGJ7_TILAU|nr:glycosyltransferase family 15 protein [Tilletiaria anomala UBC 951]KDN52891.1 glycosyltransferase family 15 protein [Tilletiaria anomala UBC 951]
MAPPRYNRLHGGSGPSAAGSGRSFLEGLARRPQRIVPLALTFFLALSFVTWLSFTSTGSETAKQWASNAKSQASGWISSAGGKGKQPEKYQASEISPADALYTFKPGDPPVTYAELEKWGEKGDDGNIYPPQFIPALANKAPRAKAGFIVLVRNSELESMQASMREVEDRFNRKYGYPWIFLNDVDFTDEFKAGVRALTRSEIRFGKVEKEHWGYPSWIDQKKAADTREKMTLKKVLYGGSESYRHMCRFQSGFFYRHPLTKDLDYYWRVEPGIKLFCDLDYDPFLFMQMNNKTYGFTMALHEYVETVPTLYSATKQFFDLNPQYMAKDASWHFLTDEPERHFDAGWNLCHMWSNFEIADLRFWRSEAYSKYFDHLDQAGGFFYERWGDAPVHSLAVSIMLDRSRLHHFNDIGYTHVPFSHCPVNRKKYHDNGKCNCKPENSFDEHPYSCLKEWWRTAKEGKPKRSSAIEERNEKLRSLGAGALVDA